MHGTKEVKYNKVEKWEKIVSLSLENSFGTIATAEDVNVSFEVGVDDARCRGYFEIYDIESGGDNWYAEGGLWFNGIRELTEYDGVFSLSKEIENKLIELGYTINL